jgi:hypothetical protein
MAAEVIARYVGRSILTINLSFIDQMVDNMVCFDRAALMMDRAAQRQHSGSTCCA